VGHTGAVELPSSLTEAPPVCATKPCAAPGTFVGPATENAGLNRRGSSLFHAGHCHALPSRFSGTSARENWAGAWPLKRAQREASPSLAKRKAAPWLGITRASQHVLQFLGHISPGVSDRLKFHDSDRKPSILLFSIRFALAAGRGGHQGRAEWRGHARAFDCSSAARPPVSTGPLAPARGPRSHGPPSTCGERHHLFRGPHHREQHIK